MADYSFDPRALYDLLFKKRQLKYGGRADMPRQSRERAVYQTPQSEMWQPGKGVQPYQPMAEVSALDPAPMDEDEFDWYDRQAGAGEEMLSNMDRQSDDLWYGRQENRGDALMNSLDAPTRMAFHAARKQRGPF